MSAAKTDKPSMAKRPAGQGSRTAPEGGANTDEAPHATVKDLDDAPTASQADAQPSRVKLRILDKEVQLACPADEQDGLLQAAAYVDRAMRELRQRNTTSSLEKIAIVTAINTASSLLEARARAGDQGDAVERVARLNSQLDVLLAAEPKD